MSMPLTTVAFVASVAVLLAALHMPLGNWIHRVFTDEHDWAPERFVYRLVGVDPRAEQSWPSYAVACVSFGVVSVALLFAVVMGQAMLPWDFGRGQDWHTALNTAISFTTNTNWQSYGGESGAGYSLATVGLTVQNFVSAGTGLAVAIALCRGLSRDRVGTIGNFWVDLVRGCLRVLLPLAAIGALVLLAGGVIQNFDAPHLVSTLTGGHQSIPGGPVASQEAIKLVGTNGGGIFNANSAHPFENPSSWTNLVEIVLLLMIPFALPRTYGLMVGDRRQGRVLLVTMASLLMLTTALAVWAEQASAHTTGFGAMEGKEERFGVVGSIIFGSASTGTSTGSVNAMHDSMSALGGGLMMTNMMLGEVSPGGVGTGLYGLLILVVVTVFIAGLMVGRTPQLLGKSIGRWEITCAALSTVVTPALVLISTGVALLVPAARAGLLTSGPHGLSEMLYAYTSAANNNGSAFAGLTADQPFLNLTLGFCMFVGRFVPIVLVLAVAGSLARQQRRPATAGTMPTHGPVFAGLLISIVLVVAGLTYFPALCLGPIAEALS
ncbi:potassium-transporting ATPase subunit KdpA [Calidifontibacter terrae]